MIDITKKDFFINIKDSNNKTVKIDTSKNEVLIDDYNLDYPWEYEKSLILREVKQYNNDLFYLLIIEWIKTIIIFAENFEIKEEILSFFWDVDLLIIKSSKSTIPIVENIEAKIIIPFGEQKDIVLNHSWHKEEVSIFKIKNKETIWDNTEFINLV